MDYFGDSIECPNCAELIKQNAIACRFCNYGLSNDHYRNCSSCDERIKIQAKLCRFCGSVGNKGPRVKVPEQVPSGVYGSSVKQQVFEVTIRQAMAGAPWREICMGPLKAVGIDPKEIEEELGRRKAGLPKKNETQEDGHNDSQSASVFPYDSNDRVIAPLLESNKVDAKRKEKDKKKNGKNKDKKREEKGKSKHKDKNKDEESKE